MPLLYVVRRANDEFMAAGTAQELAKRLNVTMAYFRRMASEDWHERYPKLPYAYAVGTKDGGWHQSRANDISVYRLMEMGLSAQDVAETLGISELRAESAYNRVKGGRYGPCDQL